MLNIGKKIYDRRTQLKMSQVALANKLGITSGAVSKWEKGNGDPSLEMITKVAKALDVTVDYLVTDKISTDKSGYGFMLKQETNGKQTNGVSQNHEVAIVFKKRNEKIVRKALLKKFPNIYLDLRMKDNLLNYDLYGFCLPITESEFVDFYLSDIELLNKIVVIGPDSLMDRIYHILKDAVYEYEDLGIDDYLNKTEIIE